MSALVSAGADKYASPLTVEDYCDVKVNSPSVIRDITPLQDGETYAAISDDHRSIDIYSYKTGKKTGVLFSIDGQKGDLKISEFEGLALEQHQEDLSP